MDYFDIVLYGGYGLGNFGDDILMLAFVNWIKRISTQATIALVVVRNDLDYISEILPDVAIVERSSPSLITSSLFIYGGGTQWYSFPKTHGHKPIIGELYSRIKNRTNEIKDSDKYNAQVNLALGIGLGPFLAGNEKQTLNIFKRFQYIGVRDQESYRICQKHTIDQSFLRADVCYADKLWNRSGIQKKTAGSKKIILIPRDWPHTTEGSKFLDPLYNVAKQFRNKGYQVEYLIFSKLREVLTMKYLDEKGEKCIVWDPREDPDIDQFLTCLAKSDLVISARYHGIVAAATLGIPSIAIEVEQKLTLASQTLSSGCLLWKQPFSQQELVTLINNIFDNYDQFVKAINEQTLIQKNLANVMLCETAHYF